VRTVSQSIRWFRETELSLSLEAFKTHLDTALSNLVLPQSCPYFEQCVGLDTS